jgi:O-antigen/teichoic acid export membrane protein
LLAWLILLATASVLAGLAQPICVGLHRGYQAYVATAAVHLGAIPLLVLAAWRRAPFFVLAALFVAPPLVSGVGLWLWGLSRRWFTVARRSQPGALGAFWRVGAPFLAMDLVTSLIVRTPEAILSRTQGLVDAGRYSVITRFPFLLNAVLIVVLQPLWPSFASAARAADLGQARALVRRAYGATLALWLLFAVFVMALGKLLVRKWLGANADGPAALLPYGVALALAQSLHYCASLVLVGLGARGQNLRVNVVMLIAYVPLAFGLAKSAGAGGIFVALIVVFGLVGAPLAFLTGQRLLGRWAAGVPGTTT